MNENKLKELNDLLSEVFTEFKSHKCELILKDSFPIMWFGDMEAYMHSRQRIVTIGLNPSDREFEEGTNRFNGAKEAIEKDDIWSYTNAMNRYFDKENNTYTGWFSHYNKVLSGLDATYGECFGEKKENTAVHIDFVPVATTKKWSKMRTKEKRFLVCQSREHLQRLICILNPNIIVASVNSQMMIGMFQTKDKTPIKAYNNGKGKRKGYIRVFQLDNNYKVANGYERLLIWGQCMYVPFGAISVNKERGETIGKIIKNILK